jgi:hypothetical protein
MKTIQQYDEIRRVSEEQATNLVNSGWRYVPKSVWKEKVRNVTTKTRKKGKKKNA